MSFGILKLSADDSFQSEEPQERAFLLMTGHVRLEWSDPARSGSEEVQRGSLLDEEPIVLHVGSRAKVRITCISPDAELAIQKTANDKPLPARLWKPGDYRSDRFGEGTMQDTSTRTVRTVFDAATAPESNMVIGEVINHPGKWSSYPPHDHAQPEVYHYRFYPEGGFGHAEEEDQVYKMHSYDTYVIPPFRTHSQCAAPGYAMYYIWMIPHLPSNRFGPDSRVFRDEHKWVMEPSAPIWSGAGV